MLARSHTGYATSSSARGRASSIPPESRGKRRSANGTPTRPRHATTSTKTTACVKLRSVPFRGHAVDRRAARTATLTSRAVAREDTLMGLMKAGFRDALIAVALAAVVGTATVVSAFA